MGDFPRQLTTDASQGALVVPRTPMEASISQIWQDLLGEVPIGVESEFFALGGDSLSAVRMLAAVEEVLLAQVSFTDFLDSPTVAALALLVERASGLPEDAARPAAPLTRGPSSGRAVCSFAQERLLFLEAFGGASAAYNMPIGVRLRGPIDADALERSLLAIVRRHGALRTTFASDLGSPVQITTAETTFALSTVDLRNHTDPEAEAQRVVDELASSLLDLERGPLMRALLLRLGDEDHVLELVFHHIICDGWSHVVIFRELDALYRGYALGENPQLPEPRAQYPDYARWQRDKLVGPSLQEQLQPWLERLAGAPAVLELPTDRPRPVVPTYRGATHRMAVPAHLARAVGEFSRSSSATPFATLLAAYCVLLARHSGQDEIVVGATTAGREGPELDDAVGLFASTVALRVDVTGARSFRDHVGNVRDVVLWALAHQDAPFEQLVALLVPERDLSRHPLFQVFCAHVPATELTLGDARPFDARPATSRFDLTLFVEEEQGGSLELAWEYSTDLFEPATIERMGSQYLRLLEAALADPEQPVDELPLLDETERRAVLAAAGEAAIDYPVACLHELFESRAAEAPDAIAVTCEGVSISYEDLNQQANRLAHHLRASGAGPDGLVALFLEPSVELVVAIIGVLKAGAAYVPLDPEHPGERLGFVLADTGARLLVTREELLDRLPAHAATVVCLGRDDALAGASTANPAPIADPDHLAYVIYTSGSTGTPKGVAVEHRNVARLFTATDAWFGFGPSDTWLLAHSYAFDFSVWELWGALAYGGRLVVSPRWTTRSPPALAALVAEEHVTVLNATPSLFAALQEELLRRADDLALRFIVFGGEALQTAALRPWFDRRGDSGATLVNMYGITETTVHVTYRPLRAADSARDASPIGVPIPDLQVYVLDAQGRPAPFGVAGELYVGGAGVARGYLNRPELTAERFLANPFGPGRLYRTGDVARRLASGELEFRGRIDDQVKIRGFRIELGEIQAAIREHAGVADAAVVALEAAPGDMRLAAYVVAERGASDPAATQLRADLLARLEQKLPTYMVPASLTFLERIPLTRNGKTDRAALPPPTWEAQPAGRFVAPQTPTELLIAEIWKEVLGVERVGADDSFFNLGGHSLLAARVVTRVRDRCAVELSVRALFEEPTLGGFAAHVDGAASSVSVAPPTVEHADPRPPPDNARAASYPLAFPQQQLLFFDELTPGSATYNAALAIGVVGDLDHDALRVALTDLFERHEALRTVLVWGDATPTQVPLDQWNAELPVVELSEVPSQERGAELERLLREHARRPFDLAKDLMLRTTLFRLGSDEHVILFQPHHVAFDAWAVEILYRDLSEFYDARRAGRAPRLPELALQYGDFALWQREHLQGELLASKLDFWRTQLAGAPTTLRIPTDHRRPSLQTFEGATHRIALDRDLADAVRDAGHAAGVTPYMVLLAAFATLLYRVGGQDDILIGGPMANRERGGFEDAIGFFANTIVVRVRLGGNPPFATLLERVRDSVLASYEHQDVPFEMVVEALRPTRDPALNPLFQVNFRVRVGAPPTLELAGTQTSQIPVDLGFARFDLALELHLLEDRVLGELIFNTALFEAASVARLAADFEALLRQAVGRPQTLLLGFELPPPPGSGTNEPGAPSPKTGIRRLRVPSGPPDADA
jgi:amino acid adenylation domain-containing protein